MQTQRDGKAEYERLRDLYPRDIGRRISVEDLLLRWGVDRLYLEQLACSGDLIPSWDGLPIDVDTNDSRGAFRVMVNVEGPGLKAHHLQTGGDSTVIGDMAVYCHLPDKATYWLPAVLDWESQHPALRRPEGDNRGTGVNVVGTKDGVVADPARLGTPAPVLARDQWSKMFPFHLWLYDTWKDLGHPGGPRFFQKLCRMKNQPNSPIRDYWHGDAKTRAGLAWEMDKTKGEISKRTIQNLVSKFRKRVQEEAAENVSSENFS